MRPLPGASGVRVEDVRTVVLAAGRSQRMGFDKLAASFAGEPLVCRVARALAELEPLFVTTDRVADALTGIARIQVLITAPTAGPAETLALAHGAVADREYLAVLPADLPFIDAARVRAFVGAIDDDIDLAWPVVDGVPGHPVVWSVRARARIPALRADEAPSRVRDDPRLRALAIPMIDDAYVTDVDTPAAWTAAESRAQAARGRT